MDMKIYTGKIRSKNSPKTVKTAYGTWAHQVQRYPNQVTYDSREFISWWLDQLKTFKGHIPVVLRIDPDKQFSFENISMVDKSIKFYSKNINAVKASESYSGQVDRCTNKKNKRYYRYGLRGIKVLYTRHQFIDWWLHNIKSFKGKIPTVGRIDHDGNYEFSNIILEDKSENSRERAFRLGGIQKIKSVALVNPVKRIILSEFKSGSEAAKLESTPQVNVSRSCRLKTTLRNGKTFRFLEEII